MNKSNSMLWAGSLIASGLLALASGTTHAVVVGDLLTNSSSTSAWQTCDNANAIADTLLLDAGGCAYRETPAEEGVTYKMTCGVTTVKYSSITLAFLDADDNTIASETTEIFDHTTGLSSVTLEAPAGTATAAVGIYGEAGSGFQDCVLVAANPPPEPTDGSISGAAWFDEDADSLFDIRESIIPNTPVSLFQNGQLIAQTQTDLDGSYNFGGLDVDQCYDILFAPADATLQFTDPGRDNDAINDGATINICLTEDVPNVTDIDAGFVAVPPVVPPADYAVCGLTWLDDDSSGSFAGSDSVLSNIEVTLVNITTGESQATESNDRGKFHFGSLTAGDYKLQFTAPAGHIFTTGSSTPDAGSSFAIDNGMTPQFNVPADSNTDADAVCTVRNANAGFIAEPVALPPTIANDDVVDGFVGDALLVEILANDEACDGNIAEVDLIGHNVPGNVSYDASSGQFQITDTTDSGTYTIEYGVRGACGSYDTAVVTVEIEQTPPPPPPAAPPEPYGCQIETGGASWGGVDIFSETEFGFSSQYNLYDADRNLVFTGNSDDVSHHVFFNGQWEIEWEGLEYGYDQLSIFFVAAVENGVATNLVECPRRAISPIAIDADNNGNIEYVRGDFSFDLTGDGIDESLMAWFGPNEGILIYKDFGTKISGEHLFGNTDGPHGQYADGFDKLAIEDTNNDGEISGEELDVLAIWTDRNSNTTIDAGEISTIASHGITSLAVEDYKFFARASLVNGKTLMMQDLWFPLTPISQASK